MTKIRCIWIHVTLSLSLTIAGCDAKDNTVNNTLPTYVQVEKERNASVAVGYDENGRFKLKEDNYVSLLFDNKSDTWWTSEAIGCEKVGISVALEKPAYFKRVSIFHYGNVVPTIGSLTVVQSSNEDSHEVWSHSIILTEDKMQILNLDGEYYPLVLKGKVFILFLKQCNVAKGRLEISDIKFEFSDIPMIKPVLTAKEIKAAVKSLMSPNDNSWHFLDDENDPSKEKYLSHLMYYGLLGDAEADMLFKSYYPSAVDLSEDQSTLKSWYKENKTK